MTSFEQYNVTRPSIIGRDNRLFIGGEWVEAASGQKIESLNPATQEHLGTLARGDTEDVNRAVSAARKAFEGDWSKWNAHERKKLLIRIHDLVEANYDELALLDTLDMGAPVSRTKILKNFLLQLILFYASQTSIDGEVLDNNLPGDMMTMKLKAPVGVVGGIIPWNAPLMSQWWIIGPVLATGCTAVLKPAEDASLTVVRMAELIEQAGAPKGVLNIITGYGQEAGSALAAHPDVDRVAFTGSPQTGRKILEGSLGNLKRVSLELGGKSPDIVFADADLDKAVPGASMGVFSNSGQICAAGTRVFVQRPIYDEFVSRAADFSRSLKLGNGLDPEVNLGPIVSKRQLERVTNYIDIGNSEGAELVAGGSRPMGDLAAGNFVQPTIFANVNNTMRIAQEEIFGPVASIIPFDDMDEALSLANDTPYGLSGGVWTQSLSTAHKVVKRVKAGTMYVNAYGQLDPLVGFGGYKMSGYGWKGSREQVESYLYNKAVYMNLD